MSTIAESHLSNKDLAPTGPEQRTWGTYHLAALWVGLIWTGVCALAAWAIFKFKELASVTV